MAQPFAPLGTRARVSTLLMLALFVIGSVSIPRPVQADAVRRAAERIRLPDLQVPAPPARLRGHGPAT